MLGITCVGRFNRKQFWIRILISYIILSFFTDDMKQIHNGSYYATQSGPMAVFNNTFIDALSATANDILLIRQTSINDQNNDLAPAILLEKALDEIDIAFQKYSEQDLKASFIAQAKARGIKESELPSIESIPNMKNVIQESTKVNRVQFKSILEKMIVNPNDTNGCPVMYLLILPIGKLIIDAKSIPIDTLQKMTASNNITDTITTNKAPTNPAYLLIKLMVLGLYFMLYSMSVAIRRGHDLNKSGLLTCLVCLIPLVGLIYFYIYLGFFKGKSESNQYD